MTNITALVMRISGRRAMVDESEFLKFVEGSEVPEDVVSFLKDSILVLPGETEEQFLDMMAMMVIDIDPQSNIEWLRVIDLACLWWEIQRYRNWKFAIIKANRAAALEAALYKSDPNYRLLGPQAAIQAQAKVDSDKWHRDSSHRSQLNVRLLEHGYNAQGINAHAFVAELGALATIERFLASARTQVNVILREIAVHREFAKRAREALEKRLAAESMQGDEGEQLAEK